MNKIIYLSENNVLNSVPVDYNPTTTNFEATIEGRSFILTVLLNSNKVFLKGIMNEYETAQAYTDYQLPIQPNQYETSRHIEFSFNDIMLVQSGELTSITDLFPKTFFIEDFVKKSKFNVPENMSNIVSGNPYQPSALLLNFATPTPTTVLIPYSELLEDTHLGKNLYRKNITFEGGGVFQIQIYSWTENGRIQFDLSTNYGGQAYDCELRYDE